MKKEGGDHLVSLLERLVPNRFGMDMPCMAFYEGVNPKTIWNNCHQLCFNRYRRRHRGVRQPKSALCHLPE